MLAQTPISSILHLSFFFSPPFSASPFLCYSSPLAFLYFVPLLHFFNWFSAFLLIHLYFYPATFLLPFLFYTPSYSEQRKVCQACYKVIESYLKGDSRKNENYLARFIKLFQKQVGAHTDTPEEIA